MIRRRYAITGMCSLLAATPPTLGAFADFDTLGEGFYGEILTYGGITFYNPDEHLSTGPGGTFAIDDVSAIIPLVPEWASLITSPNCLGMTGYGVGPTGLGSRFGELSMTTGRMQDFARMDIFVSDWGMPDEFAITLEAYLQDRLVAVSTIPLGSQRTRHESLSISGVAFDALRLAATGPDLAKAYFIGAVDNVLIVPEPSLPATLFLAGLCISRRGRAFGVR